MDWVEKMHEFEDEFRMGWSIHEIAGRRGLTVEQLRAFMVEATARELGQIDE